MSKLQLGGLLVDTIGQLKVGSSNVLAVYAGSVQVFPASTTTTTSTTSTTTTTLIPTTTTTSTTTSTTTPIPTTTTTSTTSTTTIPPTTTTTSTTTTTTTSACTSYTVFDVPDASSSTFTYQDCSTLETVSVTISDGGDEVTFCAITGTISVVSGNVTIVDNGPCIPTTTTSTTTTTTTIAYYTFGLGVFSSSFSEACAQYTFQQINYYAAVSTLADGVILYFDDTLSAFAPDNYYSDGVNSWLITGGNGVLTSQRSCTPINMVLAATYTGVSEMSIDLNISSAIPDSATLLFNWCTDSGASGFAQFTMNSGTTGDIAIPSINLSSTGNNTNSTAWGSYGYVVLESSGTTVNQFNVKTLSIAYSTADTTKTVILDYPSVDDACANAAPVVDYCIHGC